MGANSQKAHTLHALKIHPFNVNKKIFTYPSKVIDPLMQILPLPKSAVIPDGHKFIVSIKNAAPPKIAEIKNILIKVHLSKIFKTKTIKEINKKIKIL